MASVTMCLRSPACWLDYTTAYAKGADLLPPELTASLEASLVRSLADVELRRALAAAAGALLVELERADAVLAARLRPVLQEVAQMEA